MTVALELQHSIDNVFKDFRTGYTPLLVYMPYQQYRNAALFGIF